MRWNGSRHFELRATPHAAGGSQSGRQFYALKTAAVVQLQGGRCDGMAHAISSFVQRRTPKADLNQFTSFTR